MDSYCQGLQVMV